MSEYANPETGPDLTQGVTLADFDGQPMLRGHVGEKAVLLARLGDEIVAVGAECTHYQGPLDQGLIEGEAVRCPLHHARFSLRTGEALGAPAFDAVACWKVERGNGRIFVREQLEQKSAPQRALPGEPERIVIVGGGAAGFAAAEMLRRKGYRGQLTMLSQEPDAPCDRPNLSKDYLAGEAPEEWIPLRPADFYAEHGIDLQLSVRAAAIDVAARTVATDDGRSFAFDRLLITTGAEPVRLPIPGADLPHVFTLRSLADSRAIIAKAASARVAAVLGSGFIGLETAAALRGRGLDVHVISLDKKPLERVLGAELGSFIQEVHESHGETFHMETSIASIDATSVTLSDGTRLAADLVIIGVGVRPRVELAENAGLVTDHGIVVNERLETSSPGVFAAGDVARWPGGADGQAIRVEHWVVAERQGQVAAENMLGVNKPFHEAPFFWSVHHDVTIRYVGHAQAWDETVIEGDIAAHDCMITYRKNGETLAVATIGRDRQALEQALALGRHPGRG